MPASWARLRGFLAALIGIAAILRVAADSEGDALRIASYNLRNYLLMDRQIDGQFRKDYPKPEGEKRILRDGILKVRPDILLVQEIGSAALLQELSDDLSNEGLELSELHLVKGEDSQRHIAALWKNDLQVEAFSWVDLDFKYFKERRSIKRGLGELRIVYPDSETLYVFFLHLKSRYTSDKRDPRSARFREAEAEAAREFILERFDRDRSARYLIIGDLNDQLDSAPLRRLTQRGERRISDVLPLEDSRGEIWTHYFQRAGEYSKVDYVLASPGFLENHIWRGGILDPVDFYEGSDHRLIWIEVPSGESKS